MKTKFKKFQNDKNVKVLDKKAKTKVSGGTGMYKVNANSNSE